MIVEKSDRINLKYLTALLNSKLVTFWLKYKGKIQGDNYQVIEKVYKKFSDKNHKLAYNVNFINTLDIMKIIENK